MKVAAILLLIGSISPITLKNYLREVEVIDDLPRKTLLRECKEQCPKCDCTRQLTQQMKIPADCMDYTMEEVLAGKCKEGGTKSSKGKDKSSEDQEDEVDPAEVKKLEKKLEMMKAKLKA